MQHCAVNQRFASQPHSKSALIENYRRRGLPLPIQKIDNSFDPGMMFCLGVGVVLAAALVATMFWDNRILVLGLLSLLFLALGGFFYTRFKRSTNRPERVFAASIAELQEDLRQLRASVDHESATE